MLLFEYLYRDAGNFKAFGRVALEGELPTDQQFILRGCFADDGLFIAEQIGVPPLYQELYRSSGGATTSDHCWHEFLSLKEVNECDLPADAFRWGTAAAFLGRVRTVAEWDESLSPHFWIGGIDLRVEQQRRH